VPDLDTRRPPGSNGPSKLHRFIDASRQHISAVGRLRNRIMVRNCWVRSAVRHRWGLGFSILSLVILAAVLIVWRDLGNPSEEGANQSPQEMPEYTAEYQGDEADCYLEAGGESGTAEIGTCYDVYTKATDETQLARVTRSIVLGGQHDRSAVVRVFFHDSARYDTFATAFYFGDKRQVPPCVTLGREQLDSATVWHGIYVLSGLVGGEGEGTTCNPPKLLRPHAPDRPGL
jgi:hypothetical protein